MGDNDDRFFLVVSETLPTLETCYQFVAADPSCGAVSTFVGITRDNFQGKVVVKLSYEGYVSMGLKEMKKLVEDAVSNERYPSIRKIAMVHILGDCAIGQPSVIIACSSPHRTESIHCCEYLINELKARIPIWKLEVYQGDEGSTWKENVEWKNGKSQRVMVQATNVDEPVVPVVKLTRAKDGSSGVARFTFVNPNVFDQSIKGDVTGMFLLDQEGEISTTDVNARFSNGKPQAIECTYVMKSPEEWDRFMRFMERYGEENGLGLKKA